MDATGEVYGGGTQLYFAACDGSISVQVPFKGDGQIQAAEWKYEKYEFFSYFLFCEVWVPFGGDGQTQARWKHDNIYFFSLFFVFELQVPFKEMDKSRRLNGSMKNMKFFS